MNSYNNLYLQISAFDQLYVAWKKARRHKRYTPSAAAFERNLDVELLALHQELSNQSYCPGEYVHFVVHEPKRRLISAAPFRDRVVHHAIIHVLEPIYERKFIFDSYANRIGKGSHAALDRCTYFMHQFPFVLQCDLKQFFPSIDHAILKTILARTIACSATLHLCEKIIDSGRDVLTSEYDMQYFSNDDLWAIERPRGLPIGNLTSQFWANVYLNELDQFIKHSLRCHGYIRYVDDFLLFGHDKATLHHWREEIEAFLQNLRVTIHHNKAQICPVQQGIPFLGFTIYPDYRLLKNSKGIAYRRHLKTLWGRFKAGQLTRQEGRTSVMAWLGHVRHGDTFRLRQKLFHEITA